jgi:hypothetical protein
MCNKPDEVVIVSSTDISVFRVSATTLVPLVLGFVLLIIFGFWEAYATLEWCKYLRRQLI